MIRHLALAAIALALLGGAAAQTPQARSRAEAEASKAAQAVLPPGATSRKDGATWVITLLGEAERPATPKEAKALTDLEAAILHARADERDALRALLTADELQALDRARREISGMLPIGTWHRRIESGTIVITLPGGDTRAPTAKEEAALAALYAVVDRAEARLRSEALATAPLRILPDEALAAHEGAVRPGQMLWTQSLVFNRAAALRTDLVAQRNKRKYTLAKGATLFVVANQDGKDAYCAPRSDWIACFFDPDGDGLLDQQTNGGAPLQGVYLHVQDFAPVGEVLAPAGVEDIPSTDGYRQRAGPVWTHTTYDKATGANTVHFMLRVTPADKMSGPLIGGTARSAKLDAQGRGDIEMLGARFVVQQLDKNKLVFRITQGFPEQPFAMQTRTLYSTGYTYTPGYVPN